MVGPQKEKIDKERKMRCISLGRIHTNRDDEIARRLRKREKLISCQLLTFT